MLGKLLRILDNARVSRNIGHPNSREFDLLKFNIKNMGYSLARKLQEQLPAPGPTDPTPLGLTSRPARQSDMEAPWSRHWCAELAITPIYHRKIWELAFLLQSVYDAGLLQRSGVRALGFGCGEEPIASYLASRGIDVTVTDLAPERVARLGWAETGQHTSSLDKAFHPTLVGREQFDRHVSLRYVDMNDIPRDLRGYDLCWSICALEHLGTIRKGLDFVKNSVATLAPGGLSIHTTEFNYLSDDETIDDQPTVLFLRRHFEQLADELRRDGHFVAPLDFNVGDGVLDRFIDIPPYLCGEGWMTRDQWESLGPAAHLKLSIGGFACTCFGMVVRRDG